MRDNSIISERLHIPNLAAQLPESWKWRRLDKSCLDVADCPHSTPKIAPFGPLMVRSQDIRTGVFLVDQAAHVSEETYQDRIRRVEPTFGDLVYSREGTYFGIAAEVPRNTRVCLGQRMVLFRPDPGSMNSRFLKYWLNSPILQSHIHGQRDGTVAERLNLPTIRALPIPVAPLPVQNFIANILGTLDDKIELNRRMNQTLEAMARRLFKSWFVDFDPVRRNAAKLEGKSKKSKTSAPSHFSLRTSEFDHLFPDSFEDSTLGQIPKGWTAGTVPDAIEINPTRSLSKGTVAPWLEMSNMPTRSARALAWEYRAVGSGTKFINGDTLVARITPCLENGKTAFVDFLSEGEVGAGSTEYIVLRAKPPLPPVFAYLLARTDDFRQHLITNMTGTSGRQRAPANCLNSYPLVTPSERIAELFGEATESLFVHMKTNDEASLAVRVTRDKLLPKLLSGELTTTNDFLKDSQ
jgi:type I restriction enzyme S subunit